MKQKLKILCTVLVFLFLIGSTAYSQVESIKNDTLLARIALVNLEQTPVLNRPLGESNLPVRYKIKKVDVLKWNNDSTATVLAGGATDYIIYFGRNTLPKD